MGGSCRSCRRLHRPSILDAPDLAGVLAMSAVVDVDARVVGETGRLWDGACGKVVNLLFPVGRLQAGAQAQS